MRLGPCGPSTKWKCGLPCLKMIKNFKTLIAKSKTKCEALVSREPCVTTQVAWPWSQTWLQQGASCKFWGFKKVETLLCQQRSIVKAIVFSSSHIWMWELDYKESWVPKNWCFWTVVLEKTLESPLDCKEIQPVHPKEDSSWVFIGRTDVEAETPIFWSPDAKSWFIWKDPDSGKDLRQEGKGMTEDEMFGWHHRINGHEFG